MTLVKICGLMQLSDAPAVNQAQPDFAGFIFVPGKRRQISLAQATQLRHALQPQIKTAGVFVDAPLAEMLIPLQQGIISVIQLHGHESESTVQALQAAGAQVIQVQRQATPIQADFVLYDAAQPGSGKTFDWQQLPQQPSRPFFLAGGLNLTNVKKALTQVQPAGVDISSGVETAGLKDPAKIAAFVQAVRQFDSEVQHHAKN
ncbi:phosphoribosylanthranilate isomerase [Loigolactobacillus coryniformis]|uniref:N-(5'-phosphoribosyl)anthranilate isomerase n=1 Tax=Loigolactobacillus coryniformis subsp. torquens DSM 20004 = KCTC 3535 TaxID=1423822 RepID=A0A2D1KQP3_9LACO|nr:phosphoribosylanthranilate isomerase [Loigolactobacillus coryniformis]ATO44450.1 phosphoribosylanthranilate isomerase [Loigolactobacillus coryniformis subsp. torquens DSM 20004 = KCTC 3535]KRK85350.1 phosphoribosylanthranilate isomerase [Loigolactobacillus coryniformis subsp. torquens DSM 20004 = KCTC 3535]